MKNKKVLILDEDEVLCEEWRAVFDAAGATAVVGTDGHHGLSLFHKEKPDLLIVAADLPHLTGWEVGQHVRALSSVAVLFLLPAPSDAETIRALTAGMDDVMSKPVNTAVLFARAQAILRRTAPAPVRLSRLYHHPQLHIDLEQRQVMVQGQKVRLTPTEFKLLSYLVKNAGRLVTFEQILNNVWGWGYKGSADYVHVYISHLRRKLGDDPRNPQHIVTEHSVGYWFRPQAE